MAEGKQIHALLLSFPIPTHFNPLVQLARKLSDFSENTRFVFTGIVSLHMTASGNGYSHGDGNQQNTVNGQAPFTLRTISVPDGLPFSHPRTSMSEWITCCENMKAPVEMFLPQLLQTQPRLSCIIADVFVQWAPQLAAKFKLPLYSVFTSNATACCVMSYAPRLLEQNIIPFQESSKDSHVVCPGTPPLLPREFPQSMQLEDAEDFRFKFTLNMFSHLEQTSGLILNSFYEYEPDAVKTLQNRCPVYTVGPLLLLSKNGTEEVLQQKRDGFANSEGDGCLKWLEKQPPSSVLYISFGTITTFSDIEQMKELALGIENSQQPFLWVIRQNSVSGSLEHLLPEGFLERTKERGLIITWAPQLHVLKHPSVGGFLTHCGWNSILENISLRGLPMLCWPDKAEQGINARLLVDFVKMGVEFKRGKDGMVNRVEFEKAIRAVMQGDEGHEMRQRGIELKKQTENAVKEDGSSRVNIEALLQSMESQL